MDFLIACIVCLVCWLIYRFLNWVLDSNDESAYKSLTDNEVNYMISVLEEGSKIIRNVSAISNMVSIIPTGSGSIFAYIYIEDGYSLSEAKTCFGKFIGDWELYEEDGVVKIRKFFLWTKEKGYIKVLKDKIVGKYSNWVFCDNKTYCTIYYR